MDETLSQLSDAVGQQSWVAVVLLALVIVVPLVLKALGKQIALVDSAVALLRNVAAGLVKQKKAEVEKLQPGVTAVVKVIDVKKDMGSDTLK